MSVKAGGKKVDGHWNFQSARPSNCRLIINGNLLN